MKFISRLSFAFVMLLSAFAFSANAQQVHFVYLQTENSQSFYVKVNNKVVSSSSEGYVIIPNLVDDAYEMVIGFPKNEFPEEKFTVTVDKKNEGFLLKDFGEKGWSLFNMQTLALINKTETPTVAATIKIQDDPFSKMLASVVKDSSLLQKIEPVAEKPTDTVAQTPAVTIVDTPATAGVTVVEKPDSNTIETPVVEKPAPITKILSLREKEGVEMIYVDKGEKDNDTVRIFMPVSQEENKPEENKKEAKITVIEGKVVDAPPGIDTSRLTITPTVITAPPSSYDARETPVVKDSLFEKREPAEPRAIIIYDSSSASSKVPNNTANKDGQIVVLPRAVTSSKVNSDCKAFATDSDFLKLRKKMAAENNNDDMINAAKKVFRSQCFSTEQIRNLSYLFLNDEGKYMFFDAAYAYTSDSDQYANLESQLTDPYYITRFKAMIHK
jgi:hypothetical protein